MFRTGRDVAVWFLTIFLAGTIAGAIFDGRGPCQLYLAWTVAAAAFSAGAMDAWVSKAENAFAATVFALFVGVMISGFAAAPAYAGWHIGATLKSLATGRAAGSLCDVSISVEDYWMIQNDLERLRRLDEAE